MPTSGLERFAIIFVTLYVYFRLSFLHEFLAKKAGANLYIVVLLGALAYTGLLRGQTWRAASASKVFWYWLSFSVLLLIDLPFSTWRGGSYAITIPFIKDNFFCLPLIAGLFGTWRLVRRLMMTIACAGVTVIILTMLWHSDIQGRLIASWTGSIGNPNDVAGHLLFALPFILFAGLSRHNNIVVRLAFLSSIPFALYMILLTGSRGAFVGIECCFVYVIATGSTKLRLSFLVLGPVLAGVLMVTVPGANLKRLLTFDQQQDNEAVASYEARRALLVNSIEATIHHPIFGVGAGQFGSFEGGKAIAEGHPHSNWQQTHNTYTEVSSEDGIPALICMVAGVLGTFLVFFKTGRALRGHPELSDMSLAAFLLSTSMAGFCVCIFFLNFAYAPYLVILAGMAIALEHARTIRETPDEDGTLRAPVPSYAVTR